MQEQVVVSLDEKGRIMIPKNMRKSLKAEKGRSLMLSYSNGSVLIKAVKNLKGNNRVLWDLDHPMHVSPKKLKMVNLKKVEEEMWYP